MRVFGEKKMFLISSFMQFALVLCFIIFEFCHILKISIMICRDHYFAIFSEFS